MLTLDGFVALKRSRATSHHKPVFYISRSLPLKDHNHWQLMDKLEGLGWVLAPKPRGTVDALVLSRDSPVVGSVYFTKKLEISREYLLCLSQTMELANAGVLQIQDKCKSSYYNLMLRQLGGDDQLTGSMLQDDSAQMSLDAVHRPLLALEDRAIGDGDQGGDDDCDSDKSWRGLGDAGEGDPDSSDDDTAQPSSANAPRVPVTDGVYDHENFGPFVLKVRKMNKSDGSVEESWTCKCPMHRDSADAIGTYCTKALMFKTIEGRALTRLQLRQWCLEGRRFAHRADLSDKSNSHKWCDPRKLTVDTEAEQNATLHTALQSVTWILGAGDDA